MRTFKAEPTNAFFATVNQMFGVVKALGKRVVLGVLLSGVDNCLSICHYIQLDISNTATASYDSPTKSHCRHFQVSNSEVVADYDKSVVLGKPGRPVAVNMEVGSS